MWKWIEKIGPMYIAHFLLIPIITTSILSMVGCISVSPGIQQLFIAELPDSNVQFGYIGICRSGGNATVCTLALATPPADLAKTLSLSIDVVHHVLALQQSVSLVLPALSGILIFGGYIAFVIARFTTSEKSVKSRRRWIATTRIVLWSAVGTAFATAYLLTFSISAMEVVASLAQARTSSTLTTLTTSTTPTTSAGLAVTKGSSLQILQWAVFSITALFVSTVHYILHKIVKEPLDGLPREVEARTGDTEAAKDDTKPGTEKDAPATGTSVPPSAPPLPSPLAMSPQNLQYSAIHSIY
ncbi:hypothetical protein VE04_05600 [Pseudogymnoascus sp. 24MN13]|nr:hypothetical protein VE04_05600 [Pseudogymnoascus sp. 24MN13]